MVRQQHERVHLLMDPRRDVPLVQYMTGRYSTLKKNLPAATADAAMTHSA